MPRLLIAAALLLTTSLASAADVTITKGPSTAVIRIGDEIAGTYRFGKDLPKPYLIAVSAPGAIDLLVKELGQAPADEFAPGNRVFVAVEDAALRTTKTAADTPVAKFGEILNVSEFQDGWLKLADRNAWIQARDVVPLKAMVTRVVNLQPPAIKDKTHPTYYDHPHHKGVWVSVDEVNGIKFWAEDGKIENAGVEVVQASGDPAVLKVTNHWLDADGRPLVVETATISIHANRLFDYDLTFSAADKPVTFDDTKEGMFAIRLPNSMREMIAKGPVVTAEGGQGTKGAWGRPAAWIDYVGPVAGHNFGVTVMDDPKNPRASRYHVRDYGLFAINPFGQGAYTKGTDGEIPAAPLALKPGESARFRYGLYIHRGDAAEGHVAEAYEQFKTTRRE
jgi:hypothetical protein